LSIHKCKNHVEYIRLTVYLGKTLKYPRRLHPHAMNEKEKQPEPAKPPKYIRVFSIEQANTRHKEGYRVHSVIVTHDALADQNPRSSISYLMTTT